MPIARQQRFILTSARRVWGRYRVLWTPSSLRKEANDIIGQIGRNSASARGGISEISSDIIPNPDKKRNRGAFVNELSEMRADMVYLKYDSKNLY